MAPNEAQLHCFDLDLGSFQQQLERLAAAPSVELNWLDRFNASMALLLPPRNSSSSCTLMPYPPDCRGGRARRERNNRSGRPGKGRNPIDA